MKALPSRAVMVSCYFLLFTGFAPDTMAQMSSNDVSAVFDIALRNQLTGQRARMIIKWGASGRGAALQRCIQFNFEPVMKCRVFFDGIAGPEYPSPAPPMGQAQISTAGPKMNLRGRGRWRDWEIIGSFQYSQP